MVEITSPTRGLVGYLHEIECKSEDSVLVVQLPRATKHLNEAYINQAKADITKMLPAGRSVLLIGADVNIYELAGEEAVMLLLQGLIPAV